MIIGTRSAFIFQSGAGADGLQPLELRFSSSSFTMLFVVLSTDSGFQRGNSVAVAQDLRHIGPFLDGCWSKTYNPLV